jgi:hypothetical protein
VLGEDEDLLHEELVAQNDKEASNSVEEALADFASENALPAVEEIVDADLPFDLQPGGIGSGLTESVVPDSAAKGSVLDTMTLSELKRLAEQRSITGASKLRKQALIEAIRSASSASPFDAKEGTIEFS